MGSSFLGLFLAFQLKNGQQTQQHHFGLTPVDPETSESMTLKTLIVMGSARLPLEQRLGDRVGKFIVNSVAKRKDKLSIVEYVDLGKVKFPILEKPHYHYKDPKEAPQILQDYAKKIQDSDAFIIVSPEYVRRSNLLRARRGNNPRTTDVATTRRTIPFPRHCPTSWTTSRRASSSASPR